MKEFNITGTCFPDKHYMVDISDTLDKMQRMVDDGKYFTINRGRQYGKTTTMSLLRRRLESAGYAVFFLSFEGLDDPAFESLSSLLSHFWGLMRRQLKYGNVKNFPAEKESLFDNCREMKDEDAADTLISSLCGTTDNHIVILIDEVDQAGNYRSFLKFLGLLRNRYLQREEYPAFHSVILAGVYDIKNLKLKLRPEEEHQYNSPWNIAVGFDGDMSLQKSGIEGMINEYEADHSTGMNVETMAKLIRDYTSGYPFLVSRMCMLMDEEGEIDSWTADGFQRAIKKILLEHNTLFDDMAKKLRQFHDLHDTLYELLYTGKRFSFNAYEKSLNIAEMFGYIVNREGRTAVSNRIFETWLYELFLSESESRDKGISKEGALDKPQFIRDGVLDMGRILERFIVHYNDIFGDKDERFHEKEGRKYFLFYLKPIINGTGNYYVEEQTRDEGRMDVVVDYLGKQYVVELKIWRGAAYHEDGEEQLAGYLESLHLDSGYMLTFNFNQKKESGMTEKTVKGRIIWEAMV